jgi:hypothetical protein
MQYNICGLIIFATIEWYLQRINIKATEIGRVIYRKYCHVAGVCVTNNNGFCIYWHFFTITFNDKSSHIELLLNAV